MQPSIGQDPGSDENKRLIATIVLCALVYLGWMFFFAPKATPPEELPPGPVAGDPTRPGEPSVDDGAAAPGPDGAAPDEIPAGPPATADDLPAVEKTFTVDVKGAPDQPVTTVKGGFAATFSSHGAQVVRYALTGYGDHDAKVDEGAELPPVDLARAVGKGGARLLALKSRGGDVALRANAPYELVDEGPSHVAFTRRTGSGVSVTRRFDFSSERFGLGDQITLKNESDRPRTVELDLVLVGEAPQKSSSLFAPPLDPLTAHCKTNDDGEKIDPSDLEDGPFAMQGQLVSAGIGWQYFLAAVFPVADTKAAGCTVEHDAAEEEGGPSRMTLAVSLDAVTLAPGEEKSLATRTYLGPKQLQLLQNEGHGLDESIDFGIFGILARPILWLLVKLHGVVGNFGWAIILLTLLIKLLTFPLTQKSYVSMQQMKKVAPEMKALQQKYGHDRALLGQKQMEFYKENSINPMAGCFPMLVQMPIWFALYRTLWSSVELYQQPFFGWITDLSRPDVISGVGVAVLPFLVGALMLFQTMLQPPPEDQPQMKYVMWSMPVIFMFFMLGMPSGLSLYMVTNSVLTMAQQLYIKRKFA